VETLRRYPDFFLSEEVTVKMPTGTQMHLGVYESASAIMRKFSAVATILSRY